MQTNCPKCQQLVHIRNGITDGHLQVTGGIVQRRSCPVDKRFYANQVSLGNFSLMNCLRCGTPDVLVPRGGSPKPHLAGDGESCLASIEEMKLVIAAVTVNAATPQSEQLYGPNSFKYNYSRDLSKPSVLVPR